MAKDTSSQEYLELKVELRSLLISSQQGCNEHQLSKDYAAFNSANPIPYARLGYGSLIELLMSMPDVARIDNRFGTILIHGVPDTSTKHIKDFVMGQKKKTFKYPNQRGYGPPPRYRQPWQPPNYFQPYNQTQMRPVMPIYPNSSYFGVAPQPMQRPMYTNAMPASTPRVYPNYQTPPATNQQPAAVNGNRTLASFPPKNPDATSLPVPPSDLNSIRLTSPMNASSPTADDDSNSGADDDLADNDTSQGIIHGEHIIRLRKRVRTLLLKFKSGLWLTSFAKLYKKSFDEDFNLEEYKLKNLMSLFECVSDFVDSVRDKRPDATDRLLSLKTKYIKAAEREADTLNHSDSNTVMSTYPNDQSPVTTEQTSVPSVTHDIDRPLVDRSAFVSLDFRYKRLDYTGTKPFEGFLGDVNDPWSLNIGNRAFIPERERMMNQMQDHYNQAAELSIYDIPFEQIQLNLSCVYHGVDKRFYRVFITQIDSTSNIDQYLLNVHLVDYGVDIANIDYHSHSTDLKFLHKDYASLSTQVYACRLADVDLPPQMNQWPDQTRQRIIDCCQDWTLIVQVTGTLDSTYCVYLWFDDKYQQSLNQLLIQQLHAVACLDSSYPGFEPISPAKEIGHARLNTSTDFDMFRPVTKTVKPISNHSTNNNYIDDRLLSRTESHQHEYQKEENHVKYFIISIEHAYYLVKHPFTRRPCLPCFEVARLLEKDEAYVMQLNLVRETEIALAESNQDLFAEVRHLPESSQCRHINQARNQSTMILYDLGSVTDYLCEVKFDDGDVLDAFRHEYNSYDRPGYWNEKKSRHIFDSDVESYREDLKSRKDLLNGRRGQLESMSSTYGGSSYQNERDTIDESLNGLDQKLQSLESIVPTTVPTTDPNRNGETPASKSTKSSNQKMRETLTRIASPFDRQFGLKTCFDHFFVPDGAAEQDGDFKERFDDLCRIALNVLGLFHLEPDLIHENDRPVVNETLETIRDLMMNIAAYDPVSVYNYCLQEIEGFQPAIRSYFHEIDSIDII